MGNYNWAELFHEVYQRGVETYNSGRTSTAGFFNPVDNEFLGSIGCSEQELFDLIEDYCRGGEPSFEQVLLVTAARRDYFLFVQNGKPSTHRIDMDRLPPKSAELGGIPWLPRIIEKAQAKLRGEMPPALMYGCGGDRPFLREHNIPLADFLRVVWELDGDPKRILQYVRKESGAT